MPYISEQRKLELENELHKLLVLNSGDLNYMITTICLEYLRTKDKKSYANFNEVIGALECAKLEMYRRAVAPYEDQKIKENGDVYPS